MKLNKIIACVLCAAICFSMAGCIFDFSQLPEFPRASKMNGGEGTVQATPVPEVQVKPAETPAPAETPIPEPEATPEPEPAGSWLFGSWYGWWIISEADGEFADAKLDWADVLVKAQYSPETETVELSLTDENGKLGSVTVKALNDELFVSENGSFYGNEIAKGDWQITRNAYGCEDLVVLKDINVSTEEGSFTYSLFIKPWGSLWDDLAAKAGSSEDFFTDMLPYRYADYLAMLDQMQPVPENFDRFG